MFLPTSILPRRLSARLFHVYRHHSLRAISGRLSTRAAARKTVLPRSSEYHLAHTQHDAQLPGSAGNANSATIRAFAVMVNQQGEHTKNWLLVSSALVFVFASVCRQPDSIRLPGRLDGRSVGWRDKPAVWNLRLRDKRWWR